MSVKIVSKKVLKPKVKTRTTGTKKWCGFGRRPNNNQVIILVLFILLIIISNQSTAAVRGRNVRNLNKILLGMMASK